MMFFTPLLCKVTEFCGRILWSTVGYQFSRNSGSSQVFLHLLAGCCCQKVHFDEAGVVVYDDEI
ncbi:hypothetical protein DPMN_139455 [Dreissena polymorpha]|uniref:Uncharacterized protein n=1 Tax=Dreissena polymorpha TaxID=45954 RepID=A0A9D4JJH1_DREPO|nr:hypothetical protein DPMN_139455 [Dreissena polymorpha]